MARPMPPVSPCAPWLCSGTSTPTGLARAATTRLVALRSTTSMASSITPTGSTTCSSPPPWEGGNYEPRNPMESETLRHLIEQQFERLAPAAQEIVAAASVAGAEFAAAAVAAGVGALADEVDAQCARLARHGQFMHANGTATWPDGTVTGRYGFGHAL